MVDKVLFIILDGMGLRDEREGNAVYHASTPILDSFTMHRARSLIHTSGEVVGLPPGQAGNSEVGHENLGAGRIVDQPLTRIDRAIEDGSLSQNPAISEAFEAAMEGTGRLHLIGLVSDGGVHSHIDHLHALIEAASVHGVPELLVHAITDGRDTAPDIGDRFLAEVQDHLAEVRQATGVEAQVATVSGRYYAMDRDERWERTRLAYEAMVHGRGPTTKDPVQAIEDQQADGVTDEFVEPVVVEGVDGQVRDGDAVLTFNFRPDRMRQLVRALAMPDFEGFEVPERPGITLVTMTRYHDAFEFPAAFPKGTLTGTVGDAVAQAGRTQLRIAETEKYAHVTYFFGGGREDPLEGEDRVIVPSPDVATYDEVPEMSAVEVTDRVVEALEDEAYDLIVLNYANPDMVGHTGDMEAAQAAVEAVDTGLSRLLAAAEGRYHVLITSDHGNADQMTYPDGSPHTSHTARPTPLIYVGPGTWDLSPGIPADVGPTILELMGLAPTDEMTGSSLLVPPREEA